MAATLDEVRLKAAEKFGQAPDVVPTIHLDSDGTEIDDEDYFQTLEPNAELIAVFPGEEWMDVSGFVAEIECNMQSYLVCLCWFRSYFAQPTHYVTITTRRHSAEGDQTDSAEVERVHLKKIVGQLKNNLCNVSVLSDPDLEMLSNMDPNSLADITGKDFMEQLKEVSGRSDRMGRRWGS